VQGGVASTGALPANGALWGSEKLASRTAPRGFGPASPVLSVALCGGRWIPNLRLPRLTKSRKKCPLVQLGWGSLPGGLCFKSPVKGPAAKPLSLPHRAVPRRAGHSPSRFGTGAGRRGGAPGAQVVLPLLQAAPPGVHEEVADGGELQAQLLGDGDLHLFGGPLVLLEDGEERSALEVREDQARLLLGAAPLFVRLLLFALAGWAETERERASGRAWLPAEPPAMAPTPGLVEECPRATPGSALTPHRPPHVQRPFPMGTWALPPTTPRQSPRIQVPFLGRAQL